MESLSSPNAAELQLAKDCLSCTATADKSVCTSTHKECCCLRRPAWCCIPNGRHILLCGTLWQFLSWLISASASLGEKGGKNGEKKCLWVLKSCWLFTRNGNEFNQWEGIRMKIVTLCDDSEESISFSLTNTMPVSGSIFILVCYFLLSWSLKDIHRH